MLAMSAHVYVVMSNDFRLALPVNPIIGRDLSVAPENARPEWVGTVAETATGIRHGTVAPQYDLDRRSRTLISPNEARASMIRARAQLALIGTAIDVAVTSPPNWPRMAPAGKVSVWTLM